MASVGEKSQVCFLLRSDQSLGWDAPCVAACCAVHPSFPSLIHWLTDCHFHHHCPPDMPGVQASKCSSCLGTYAEPKRQPCSGELCQRIPQGTCHESYVMDVSDSYWVAKKSMLRITMIIVDDEVDNEWIGVSGSWIWCRAVPPIIVAKPWLAASLPASPQSVWGSWDGFVPCLPSVLPANVCLSIFIRHIIIIIIIKVETKHIEPWVFVRSGGKSRWGRNDNGILARIVNCWRSQMMP